MGNSVRFFVTAVVLILILNSCTPEPLFDYDEKVEIKATEGDDQNDKIKPGG